MLPVNLPLTPIQIKRGLERLMGHRLWLARPAQRARVEALLERLRPRGTQQPLTRIGPTGDGGYLVPDDLEGITACISPGVSLEVGFDHALAERGIDVYLADASVPGPPEPHDRFHFTPKFLDVYEDAEHLRLDTWCASVPHRGDWLLQMDIEGAEWRVLLDASPEVLKRFRILVIEFHDLKELFGRFSFDLIHATFTKLLETHSVVHLHPNNVLPPCEFAGLSVPPLMEFTFYRNDRAFSATPPSSYPHPLDAQCSAEHPPTHLPSCWYAPPVSHHDR